MIPLTMADTGIMVKIRKIGGPDKVRRHLQEMGFVVDAMISIVTSIDDNLIVAVKDSRVAISRELAERIMV